MPINNDVVTPQAQAVESKTPQNNDVADRHAVKILGRRFRMQMSELSNPIAQVLQFGDDQEQHQPAGQGMAP